MRRMSSRKRIAWGNTFFGGRLLVLQSCRFLEIELDLTPELIGELLLGNLRRCKRRFQSLRNLFLHFNSVHHVLIDFYNFSYMSRTTLSLAYRMQDNFYTESHINRLLDYNLDL